LSSVQGQADVVEGGGDEAPVADEAAAVLEDEGVVEVEGREEYADGGDEEFEFGVAVGAGFLVGDWGR